MLGHRTLELAPDLKNTFLGVITFLGTMVAVLWQPIVGGLSDHTRTRWGRRLPYFFGGAAALLAALFLLAVAPGTVALMILLLLVQLSSNTIQAPSQALLPDHVPEAQRGSASGWKSALEILAFVIGRQISGRLVAEGAVMAAVTVAAAAVVAAVVIVSLTLRRMTPASPPAPASHLDLRGAFRVDRRRYPAFGAWFVNRILVWGGFVALSTFLLFFVIDVLGLPEARAQRFVGDLSALMGLGLLLVALPAGWLADRVGRRRLVAAASLTAAGGTVLLLVAPTTTTALVAGAILGVAVGVFLTASWALATQIVPGMEAARMLGLANIATAAGSGLARLSGGLIIDPFNRLTGSTAGGYMLLYALAGGAFLAGAIAILRSPSGDPPSNPPPAQDPDPATVRDPQPRIR